MKPLMPLMLMSQLYAVPSPMRLVRNANKPNADVANNAGTGTPRELSFVNTFGARPFLAIAYNIRVDAYKPELPADNTAVKIIALMKLAAKAKPKRSSTKVNGLIATFSTPDFNRFGSLYGMRKPITTKEPSAASTA